MIKYLSNNKIKSIFQTPYSIVDNNLPNIIIDDLYKIIQDKSVGNQFITKLTDRCKSKTVKIYHLTTGYSILTISGCSNYLIASTDSIIEMCDTLTKELLTGRAKGLIFRYGLRGDKMLMVTFSNEKNEFITRRYGQFYTKKYNPYLNLGEFGRYEKYEDSFIEIKELYGEYVDSNAIDIKQNFLEIAEILNVIATKLKDSCGEPYKVLSSILGIVADGYKSTLSISEFRKMLHIVSHPDYKPTRRDLIKRFQFIMEVIDVKR